MWGSFRRDSSLLVTRDRDRVWSDGASLDPARRARQSGIARLLLSRPRNLRRFRVTIDYPGRTLRLE
jgi:hypothetical protein